MCCGEKMQELVLCYVISPCIIAGIFDVTMGTSAFRTRPIVGCIFYMNMDLFLAVFICSISHVKNTKISPETGKDVLR